MLEEKIKNGEQPEIQDVHTVATDENKGLEDVSGSPLGKFKDGESLLNAYNELQSEFTRKCQKLSEVEKKLQENSVDQISGVEINNVSNEFAWNNNISEFLQSHKNAESLVEEITEEILKNEDLKNSPNGLEQAYMKVIENKFTPHEDLVKNQEFLEKYIYSNDEIKNTIIKEYVSSLQNLRNPINVNNSGYNGGVATNSNFASLEEAGKYVEKLFRF